MDTKLSSGKAGSLAGLAFGIDALVLFTTSRDLWGKDESRTMGCSQRG